MDPMLAAVVATLVSAVVSLLARVYAHKKTYFLLVIVASVIAASATVYVFYFVHDNIGSPASLESGYQEQGHFRIIGQANAQNTASPQDKEEQKRQTTPREIPLIIKIAGLVLGGLLIVSLLIIGFCDENSKKFGIASGLLQTIFGILVGVVSSYTDQAIG